MKCNRALPALRLCPCETTSSRSRPPAGSFLTLFPSIMLPMFLAVVDQTIVATALPAIAASLGNIDRVSLVVVSYLVATTVAAPLYGQLRDMHGGRRMMLIALSVFLAASLLCALATSIEMLIFARVLQGLGGGGLMTLTQSLIGESVPPRERARYQGYLAAVMVTSSVFGPVVGGYLAHSFGWRSIFLINLPLGALAMLLTLRLPAGPCARNPGRSTASAWCCSSSSFCRRWWRCIRPRSCASIACRP